MGRPSFALWHILQDHISTPQDGSSYAVGRRSLAVTPENIGRCTLPFRLYDDDGVLYYEGLMAPEMLNNEMLAFEPLDWAAAFAGATRMDIKRDGKWVTL